VRSLGFEYYSVGRNWYDSFLDFDISITFLVNLSHFIPR
jgi:hypothetical protein